MSSLTVAPSCEVAPEVFGGAGGGTDPGTDGGVAPCAPEAYASFVEGGLPVEGEEGALLAVVCPPVDLEGVGGGGDCPLMPPPAPAVGARNANSVATERARTRRIMGRETERGRGLFTGVFVAGSHKSDGCARETRDSSKGTQTAATAFEIVGSSLPRRVIERDRCGATCRCLAPRRVSANRPGQDPRGSSGCASLPGRPASSTAWVARNGKCTLAGDPASTRRRPPSTWRSRRA